MQEKNAAISIAVGGFDYPDDGSGSSATGDGMAILLDVTIYGGANREQMGNTGRARGAANVPRQTFQLALESNKRWRMAPPISPHWPYVTGTAQGSWKIDWDGSYVLTDSSSGQRVMELRSPEKLGGAVYYWPRKGNRGATLYDGNGQWAPSAVPQPKTWVGFAAKGGGGAGVSGEACFGAVMRVWGGNTGGCSFMITTGRLGAVAGFSGGLAFVYATGFSSAHEFSGFTSSGADFALACGPKIAGAVSPKWAKVSSVVGKFDNSLAVVEGIVKGANPKYETLRSELPGLAKSVSQSALIDYDEKNITILDVPLCGGGAEMGVYYGWSNTRLLSSW